MKESEGETFSKKSQQLSHLIWKDIKNQCKPIGQEGWFGDCFYYSPLNLVVKKYRDAQFSNKVNEEVALLQYIQKYQQKMVHHLLYDQHVLIGFTLSFIEGKMWDQIIAQQGCIFRKSPVARVRLVLQIAEQMKHLQRIKVCHGDLHFQNILIHTENQNQDVQDPKFKSKVIDFGNGFLMQEGRGYDYGLTGWLTLIPPQVEFKYYKDYNPFGINAYQLARNAFFILFLTEFKTIESLKYTPIYQLDQLQQKHPEYPKQLHRWLSQLLHYDISRRNEALFSDMTHLQHLTRDIYLQQGQDKNKEEKKE